MEEKRIGERLKAVRLRQGLRATRVADRLNMSEGNYLQYEAGRNQLSLLQLGALAAALDMKPHDLFEELYPIGELESVGGGAELTTANAGLYLSDLLNERAAALAASDPDRVRVAEVAIISKADNCTTRHMRTRSSGRNAALVPSQAMA